MVGIQLPFVTVVGYWSAVLVVMCFFMLFGDGLVMNGLLVASDLHCLGMGAVV